MTNVKNGLRGRPPAFNRVTVVADAMQVFRAAGYDGASLSMLTDAMGISAQSLYAAFGSKEKLYREAMALYLATDGGFSALALAEEDAITAVQRLVRDAATAFAQPGIPGCMIAMAPAGGVDSALSTFGRELRHDGVHRIAERLTKGIEDGQVRADIDTLALASFIGSVVLGMSVQARDGASRAALASIAAVAAQTVTCLRA